MGDVDRTAFLDPREYPRINERFYSGPYTPHGYLNNRFRALLLATSSSPETLAAHEAGFTIGFITAKYEMDDDSEFSEETLSTYLTTESTVLVHHAAETLVRLYLAHADEPQCPWIEIASLRERGLFPKRARALRSRLTEVETQESLMCVFTGRKRNQDHKNQMPQAAWDDRQQGLAMLMSDALAKVLDGAQRYNSAKHGLSASAGNVGFEIGTPPEMGLDLSADGPAMSFLVQTATDTGRRWGIQHDWVSPAANAGLILAINRAIEDLWTVATHRYVKSQAGKGLHDLSPEIMEAVSQTEAPKSKKILFKSVTEPFVYLLPLQEEDEQP